MKTSISILAVITVQALFICLPFAQAFAKTDDIIVKNTRMSPHGVQIHDSCLKMVPTKKSAMGPVDLTVDAAKNQIDKNISKFSGATKWAQEWRSASQNIVLFCVENSEFPGFNAAYISSPEMMAKEFPNLLKSLFVKSKFSAVMGYFSGTPKKIYAEMGVTPIVLGREAFKLLLSQLDPRIVDILIHEIFHATGVNNQNIQVHNFLPDQYLPTYDYPTNSYAAKSACQSEQNITDDRVYLVSSLFGLSYQDRDLKQTAIRRFNLCTDAKCVELMTESPYLKYDYMNSSGLTPTQARLLCKQIQMSN